MTDRWKELEKDLQAIRALGEDMSEPQDWSRPTDEHDARLLMLSYEEARDYENAALAAIACADLASSRHAGCAESYERQALVYATLAAKK